VNSDHEPAGNVFPIDDQGDGRWRPGWGAPRPVLIRSVAPLLGHADLADRAFVVDIARRPR
jgi:hypothetical protein